MNVYLYLVILNIFLVIGYFSRIKAGALMQRALSCFIYIILFCVGYNIIQDEFLLNNLEKFGTISFTFVSAILCINFVFLFFYELIFKNVKTTQPESTHSNINVYKELLKILPTLLPLIIGIGFGYCIPYQETVHTVTTTLVNILLVIVMWCIGVQLHTDNISLRSAFTSKMGIKISFLVILSSWFGGIILNAFFDLSLYEILAVISGFGWYSLSAPLLSNQLSGFHGSISLLIEVSRELTCIFLIPLFIKRFPITTIGISGTSAMDFLLPLIKKNGDSSLLTVAITSGMILSVIAPLAMLSFIYLVGS